VSGREGSDDPDERVAVKSRSPKAVCYVDMPFGRNLDLASGTEIDFGYAATWKRRAES